MRIFAPPPSIKSLLIPIVLLFGFTACVATKGSRVQGKGGGGSVFDPPPAPTSEATDYECKMVKAGGVSKQVCFPVGRVCEDPHGIGDGRPIPIDCWSGGTRACHPSSLKWPGCAGGVVASQCEEVTIGGVSKNLCFPAGHTCWDGHGIGDGRPIEINCWTGSTRACHRDSSDWPSCAGGFFASDVDRNYECKMVSSSGRSRQVCFPAGHTCMDPHGIGDGRPIPVDCWSGGGRACNPGTDRWPSCASGIEIHSCKQTDVAGSNANVCFPVGHVCKDPHGIGDGRPIPIDCWEGVTRACHPGGSSWPTCAGGKVF